MGQIQSLDELLSFLLRRLKPILVVAILGMLASVVYAKTRPKLYEAAAVLQVEMPTVSEGVNATPGTDAAQIIQSIEQDLTTRAAMMAVIERHQLFAGTTGISEDRQAFLLRQAIRFQPVSSSTASAFNGNTAISALIITAQWDKPELAARIANDFAQSLLDYSAAGQLGRARETADFYRAEADRISAEMGQVESDLAGFKNLNADFLPEISAARRDEIIALETDLRLAEREVATLDTRRTALVATGSQRATDKRQLEEVAAQLAVATAQRDQITARRAELMAALARAPQVEQGLTGFDRQLTQLQDQYDLAMAQLSAAETAFQLERNNQTERFALLDRARTPEESIGTNRRKLAVAGTLASLIAAIGLAFVYEQIFPVVRTAEQLERQLSIRPIVSIPDLKPASARPRLASVIGSIDDPGRPIFGIPRYLAASAAATLALLALAALLG